MLNKHHWPRNNRLGFREQKNPTDKIPRPGLDAATFHGNIEGTEMEVSVKEETNAHPNATFNQSLGKGRHAGLKVLPRRENTLDWIELICVV